MADVQRRYRGESREERQEARRERLLAAALDCYRERGYRDTPVKAICDVAGLTERYFYESFANREAVLLNVFETAMATLLDDLRNAAGSGGLEALLGLYYARIEEDPGASRVFLVEITGVSKAIDQSVLAFVRNFADLLGETAAAKSNGLDRFGTAGAIIYIAIAWLDHGLADPRPAVVASALRACAALRDG